VGGDDDGHGRGHDERRARLETQLAMADEFLELLGHELHEAPD
jgi:hypothetical protein